MTASAGLSRTSSMSRLYATPSTRTRLPFAALRSSLRADTTFSTTYGDIGAVGRDAAHDLRRILCAPAFVAGINALRTEGHEDVFADDETARLHRRDEQLARRAGIRRALEHNELAWPRGTGDGIRRRQHVRHVGVARFGQRRRHRDRDRVELSK